MSNTGINEVQKLSSEFCYWLHIPLKLFFSTKESNNTCNKNGERNKIYCYWPRVYMAIGHVSTLAHFVLRATGHNEMEEDGETQMYEERRA